MRFVGWFIKLISLGGLFGGLVACQQGGNVLGQLDPPSTILDVPRPTIAIPAETTHYSKTGPLIIRGLCQQGSIVTLNGSDFQTTPCVDLSYEFFVHRSQDGIYPLMISQAIPGSNPSPVIHLFWVLKNSVSPPTITSPATTNPYRSGQNSITVAGSCETGSLIKLSGAADGSTTCEASTYSIDIVKHADGQHDFILTQEDLAGNTAQVPFSWQKAALTSSPGDSELIVGRPQLFTIDGGSGTYAFELIQNDSGSSLNTTTGLYTAGTQSGAVDRIRVTDTTGSELIVTINTIPDIADHLALPSDHGSDQSDFIGKVLGAPLKAQVRDRFGNPVPNYPLSFVVSSGDMTLTPPQVQTSNSLGIVELQARLGVAASRGEILVQPASGILPDVNETGQTQLAWTTFYQTNNKGNFGPSFASGGNPGAIVSADYDNDGYQDLVFLNVGDPSLGMMRNLGNGLFAPMTKIMPICAGPNDLGTGDFNEDGFADFVVTCPGSDRLALVLSDGLGQFLPVTSVLAEANESLPVGVRVIDFNDDGHLDLITSSVGGTSVSVRLGDGAGGFSVPQVVSVGLGPTQLAVADFNKDGHLDVVVVNSAAHTYSLLLNNGSGTLDPPTSEPTGTSPVAIGAADFNADGYPDFAIANNVDNNLMIFINDQYGAFMSSTFPTGLSPSALTVADVNDDQRPDLIVVNSDDSSLSVFLNQGNGTFDPQAPISTDSGPADVATADIHGDGHVDLLVTVAGESLIQVIPGDGTGRFSLRRDLAANPSACAKADLNGDGDFELMVGQKSNNTLALFSGGGRGLWNQDLVLTTLAGVSNVLARDINHDGIADIVAVHDVVPAARIFLGQASGGYAEPVDYAVGLGASGLAIHDLNRDGHPDLIVSNATANTVSLLLNDGNGAFLPKSDHLVGSAPKSVVVTDLNRDGLVDIVTANAGGGDISILMALDGGGYLASAPISIGNGPSSIVAGFFNGDSFVDLAIANELEGNIAVLIGRGDGSFQSPATYWSGNSPKSLRSGDFNGDGKIDLIVGNGVNQTLTILMGSGTGLFNTTKIIETFSSADALCTGDTNANSAVDITVIDSILATVMTLWGH